MNKKPSLFRGKQTTSRLVVNSRHRKGVEPVVSFVLIVAIILVFSLAAYLWMSDALGSLNEPGRVSSYVGQMIALDDVITGAAHGDVNFTTTFRVHHPNAFLELNENQGSLALTFSQQSQAIGFSNVTPANAACSSENCSYFYDNTTRIVLYRVETGASVFQGAQAAGPGAAEIAIKHVNITMQWGGQCIRGKTGPFTTVYVRKTSSSSQATPVVAIDLC